MPFQRLAKGRQAQHRFIGATEDRTDLVVINLPPADSTKTHFCCQNQLLNVDLPDGSFPWLRTGDQTANSSLV